MNKKDRIAVVVSIPWIVFSLLLLQDSAELSLIMASPMLAYWGYRFVKNDISFFRVKNDEK